MDRNDKDLLEIALDYAAKTCEEAEILLYQNISTPVGFEAEKLKDIETTLGDEKGKLHGKLTITTVVSFGTTWLTPRIQ